MKVTWRTQRASLPLCCVEDSAAAHRIRMDTAWSEQLSLMKDLQKALVVESLDGLVFWTLLLNVRVYLNG